MADPLENIMFKVNAGGIMLKTDPEDLPIGSLADCVNVDISRRYGSAQPREGSRSLANRDSVPNGGHPELLLGNTLWDGSAQVLGMVHDATAQILWALVRSAAGKAKVYKADLTDQAPGFDRDAGTAEFDIDDTRIPSLALHNSKLFIATGVTTAIKNVVVDTSAETIAGQTDPLQAPKPTHTTSGSGSFTTLTGYLYRSQLLSSKTGAVTALSAVSATAGPFSNKLKVIVSVGGADDAAEYDKIRIYRTTDGGGVFRFLADVNNPGKSSTVNHDDTKRDDQLSSLTAPTRFGRAPTCRFNLVHNQRMLWAARTEPPIDLNVVYHSEADNPFVVDPVFNATHVRREDGGQITGWFILYNRVFIVKSNGGIYELADNLPNSIYRVDPIVNPGGPWGCLGHQTIAVIEQAAYWLCRRGVVRFDGESIQLISQPIEPKIGEVQLDPARILGVETGEDPTEGVYEFSFTNTDIVTETFHWRIRFFEVPPTDPAVDPFSEELASGNGDHLRFLVVDGTNRTPLSSAGYELGPGQQVTLQVVPELLEVAKTYQVYLRGNDGTQYTDWCSLGEYKHKSVQPGELIVNFGLSTKFWAVDHWPTHEYWLHVASYSSDHLDQRWVFDYETLKSPEAVPIWRRELIHATAGVVTTGVNMAANNQNLAALIFGDSHGCIWISRWPGLVDHFIDDTGIKKLKTLDRTGSGTMLADDGLGAVGVVWTVTDTTQNWGPFNKRLNGNRVVVRIPETGDIFTGVIFSSTPTLFGVFQWLGGKTPPTRSMTVEYAIGGIDAHIDFALHNMANENHVTQVHQLIVRGHGPMVPVDVFVRAAQQSEPLSTGALSRMRQRHVVAKVGGKIFRKTLRLRGHYLGGRLGTWGLSQFWRLSAWGFGCRRIESRR